MTGQIWRLWRMSGRSQGTLRRYQSDVHQFYLLPRERVRVRSAHTVSLQGVPSTRPVNWFVFSNLSARASRVVFGFFIFPFGGRILSLISTSSQILSSRINDLLIHQLREKIRLNHITRGISRASQSFNVTPLLSYLGCPDFELNGVFLMSHRCSALSSAGSQPRTF